jgi:geranylgeranyl pyrophosphate synthase
MAIVMPDNVFVLDQDFLRERLVQFLQEQGLLPETALGADVRQALAAPGKLLSLTPDVISTQHIPTGIRALLPLSIARYCDPEAHPQLLSCIALCSECFLCALDLLDDVEDDDFNALRQQLGDARLLNVATVLLSLASQALLTATRYGLPYERLHSLLSVFHQQWQRATLGQHRDLLAEQRSMQEISTEECLHIIEDKSGSLLSLVCSLAALSVGASATISDLFAYAGFQIGIAHQIDNDINDLSTLLNPVPTVAGHVYKSDLMRGKKTLPIVLANERLAHYQVQCGCVPQQSFHSQAYDEALKASLAVAFYYRSQAALIVQEIETIYGTPLSPELRFLLSLDGLPLQGVLRDAYTP